MTSAARREQLVRAATTILARGGLRGLTTRAVTAEAGASLASLHYAFDGVDSLLRAVLQHSLTVTRNELSRELPQGLPLDAAVRTCVAGIWRLVEANEELQTSQYELTLHFLRNASDDAGARQYRSYVQIIEDQIRFMTKVDDLPDQRMLMALCRRLAAILDGLILQHLVEPDPGRSRNDLRMLTDAVLHGLRDDQTSTDWVTIDAAGSVIPPSAVVLEPGP
ncbi:TetR/AcrR family transcriptional regulator [Micromonospora andamanensis]|uniref:Transcriptional regulator, TetR family protein n=1 Tax=Micromonospora andamanensis TaxID=1287068 RepID=A0ABQ4I2H3_9ACTN|nr:TetR family transcriptional regulator [Micromonospora andamanensis]GIJ12089.1 putative transcriptional regulator, TetR family protein [Micromonospora andamanensis]